MQIIHLTCSTVVGLLHFTCAIPHTGANYVLRRSQQDPRFPLNFFISGLVYVERTEDLYYDNPELQNSVEIGDLAATLLDTTTVVGCCRRHVAMRSGIIVYNTTSRVQSAD